MYIVVYIIYTTRPQWFLYTTRILKYIFIYRQYLRNTTNTLQRGGKTDQVCSDFLNPIRKILEEFFAQPHNRRRFSRTIRLTRIEDDTRSVDFILPASVEVTEYGTQTIIIKIAGSYYIVVALQCCCRIVSTYTI